MVSHLWGSGRVILVTGPARSGKSEWAETLAEQSEKPVIYVATAQRDPTDEEWQQRIARHQQRRPGQWQTREVPRALSQCLEEGECGECLLVDSLGTWLANCLDLEDEAWLSMEQEFLSQVKQTQADLILVAEETGWGIVPAYPLGRTFRDRLGNLIRHVGAIANPVYLVTGGYALNLTVLGTPLTPNL
ncbi:bifunctional adenosylcobinamide kinase/adenosylcobinamide-phosphate guanylyltransferase [Roseofilum capinflatum]|uniref:Adenosylcobinamide kinase n=1 Tax=Roseofilum capinflatum BLCC-M114 TaxID=3022440 RepID=A0ABT7B8R5_9CYAN|nr:bifunctional adenosylcobinamide kinase/adenosylcobinamide-phosphate guanylyltransferase [Roseofilum capinflatum]MDJ1175575.1 bifunctional adenosylcobinamide kinase/adenosylcobinamide-phosphate guanylyltransferase [Roseofilum capinflatum BLCC-M114]